MQLEDINIRDPFVLFENGKYYLYGTRAANFGQHTGGFDVYVSDDLVLWSEAKACFCSDQFALNTCVNWAPEVYKYKGEYYMFATFTQKNGLRGTYALKAENPEGPFVPHSGGALTPFEWECLDGTLYVDKFNQPYLVFCHEHTQIVNGTVCYVQLSDDLKTAVGEAKLIFSATDPYYVHISEDKNKHYITDGPFVYRSKNGSLLLLWSTFIDGKYSVCVAKSSNDEIDGRFEHLEPIIKNDGGHGMIFKAGNDLFLTYHTPNESGKERPVLKKITDNGGSIVVNDIIYG